MKHKIKTFLKISTETSVYIILPFIIEIIVWQIILTFAYGIFGCEPFDTGLFKPARFECANVTYQNFINFYSFNISDSFFLGILFLLAYFYITIPVWLGLNAALTYMYLKSGLKFPMITRSVIRKIARNKQVAKFSKSKQKQLSFPTREDGKKIGERLFKVNKNEIDRVIEEISESENTEFSVVDIGCGPGYSLIQLAKKFPNAQIFGIDPSDIMVEQAKGNSKEFSNVEVLLGKTPDLSVRDKNFDYVLMNNVTYFWEELSPHLNDIYRALKQDGQLIFYATAVECLSKKFDPKDGIFNMHTVDDMRTALTKVGFNNIQIEEFKKREDSWGHVYKARKSK